ncbi:MAG: hypothetical protein ABR587_14350, partial [Candidatus Binatia bacterium]
MLHPEERLLFRPNTSGPVSICLAYPNTWAVGMANLGYQAVYRLLATTPGVVCERVFLAADGSRPKTEESGRSPAEFDIVAFSLSFESDYPNIVRILDSAGIPARRTARRESERGWPMLLAGGPATFPTATSIVAPGSVFGDYFLVEASRGCEWGCRFCAAGFMYRPVRHRSAESLTAQALEGLPNSAAATVGLVGAEMASHPGIASTCERIAG